MKELREPSGPYLKLSTAYLVSPPSDPVISNRILYLFGDAIGACSFGAGTLFKVWATVNKHKC